METKDLRLGNYFLDKKYKDIQEVQSIQKNSVNSCFDISDIEPIYLDDKILSKLGFKLTKTRDFYGNYRSFGKLYIYNCKRAYFKYDKYTSLVYLKDISTLHQLQNLYHSLTGDEMVLSE